MRTLFYFKSFIIFISLNNCYELHYCNAENVTVKMLEDFGTRTNTSATGEISETQHATCRITTEEIVANAESKITRVLTGMCNSEIVIERFANLEGMLKREFDDIKRTLNNLLQNNDMRRYHDANHGNEEVNNFIVDPRQEEVNRFNSTIHQLHTPSGTVNVFTYFLRIDNFNDKLLNWESGRSIRSSTFYVGPRSYAMYLKVTPKYIVDGDPQIYVKFGIGVTHGRYDETLDWPFTFNQRIDILDHSMQNRGPRHRNQDLKSVISIPSNSNDSQSDFWRRPMISGDQHGDVIAADNREWIGLTLPQVLLLQSDSIQSSNSSIRTPKYLWRDSLVIKLTVFL